MYDRESLSWWVSISYTYLYDFKEVVRGVRRRGKTPEVVLYGEPGIQVVMRVTIVT